MDVVLQVIVSGILFGGIYALVSISLTLIMGVMDITNFAHGEYLMVALYATFFMNQLWNLDPYISSLIVIPLLFLFGLLSERILIRPTLNKPPFVHVFVTLGLSIILQNLALLLFSGNFRSINVPFAERSFKIFSVMINYPRLLIFVVAIAVGIGLHLFLHYTWLGKAIRATAQNKNAASLMGIDVNRVYAVTFAIGVGLVGLAGSLLMPIYSVYPTVGFQFVLVAFVAVVMGGLGSVKGAIIASLLIGLVETLSGFLIDPSVKQALYFMVFILVLLFKPYGLFGKKTKVA